MILREFLCDSFHFIKGVFFIFLCLGFFLLYQTGDITCHAFLFLLLFFRSKFLFYYYGTERRETFVFVVGRGAQQATRLTCMHPILPDPQPLPPVTQLRSSYRRIRYRSPLQLLSSSTTTVSTNSFPLSFVQPI